MGGRTGKVRIDATDRLHAAVAAWVRSKGGTAVVTSGPEVQDWNEGKYKFRVAIRCTGRPPRKAQ